MRALSARLLAAALLAGVAVASLPAEAAKFPAAFAVDNVPVDATGANATAARDAARHQGQVKALQMLLQRLTAESDWPHLPTVTDQIANNLVLDYSVADEHSSATHYLGTYTFRFSPKGVRQLLQSAHLSATELTSKPVVVVPLLRQDGQTHLWDDPNPWRNAWTAQAGKGGGLVPWVVPAGDVEDLAAMNAAAAAHPTPAQLSALAGHYDNGDVTVVTADAHKTADGASLAITVARYKADGTVVPQSTEVKGPALDNALYVAGVAAASQLLDSGWKKIADQGGATAAAGPDAAAGAGTPVSALPPGTGTVVDVRIPIGGLADWGSVRERLSRVPSVQVEEIDVITRNQVQLKLRVSGTADTTRLALAQQDLGFDPQPDGSAVVSLHAAPGAASGAASGMPASAPKVLSPLAPSNLEAPAGAVQAPPAAAPAASPATTGAATPAYPGSNYPPPVGPVHQYTTSAPPGEPSGFPTPVTLPPGTDSNGE